MSKTIQHIGFTSKYSFTYKDDFGGQNVTHFEKNLYFKNEAEDGALYSLNLETSEKNEVLPYNSSHINVYKNKIYFSNKSDKNRLYCCNLDGSDLKCLSTDNVQLLNVAANVLYYKSITERGQFCSIDIK